MGVVEGCPKPAHAEAVSPSSMITCHVFQPGGLYMEREGLDKRPACKHAIVALSIWSRNGWYEQLVITGNVAASLSPVKCATCTGSLAPVTMGEKHRHSECSLLSRYIRDLEGVARGWKCRSLLLQPQIYHLC